MNKKLTKFDIMMVMGFIFSLVIGVGAFFFGLQVGKEQIEVKYKEAIDELTDKQNQDNISYHQQQLVSFYHTVLLPFHEFQETWFHHMETVESDSLSTDGNALLKELGRLAKEKAEEIKPSTIPSVSPLLQEAQADYLKSLTLFAEASHRLQNGSKGAVLAGAMRRDDYVLEAASYALDAQAKFYQAIWKWNEANAPGLTGGELIGKDNLTLDEWRDLNLNGKNAFLAQILHKEGTFVPFYPQDMAARIDDLDAEGKLGELQIKDVRSAASMLFATGAVRTNDYLASKDKHYRNEQVPQLPFF